MAGKPLVWRQGVRIGRSQRIVTWRKPVQQPGGGMLDIDEWRSKKLANDWPIGWNLRVFEMHR